MTSHTPGNQSAELVFRSATFREEFGRGGFAFLSIALLLQFVLLAGVGYLTAGLALFLGALVLYILAFGALAVVIASTRGRLELSEDGLVETNLLNRQRTFRYAQIIDFRNGAHSNVLHIRFHPLGKDGEIDDQQVRGTTLISVRDLVGLKFVLARRIGSPNEG